MAVKKLLAISVDRGVIQVLLPNGNIAYFSQRGIKSYSPELRALFVAHNILQPYALTIPELPKTYSIEFERPDIQGRAYASFNPKRSPNYSQVMNQLY